ncbi:hypothetical protein [Polymorphobacter megasporae]|uniref:hypothetical protein n=1 Tax=Glacieibacterium megasporae TaxID=2835787 RepID=UPI001C1DD681|nr:hypothetical protein [Polymorphobacter megasporae]UAJ10457.1 hypothetical protein KTC28_01455 [Polymorphobacter megasporae]
MTEMMTSRARAVRLLETCSLAALLVTGQAANAACSPNPTQSGTATTCAETESAGLVIGTSATVTVSAGALVTAPAGVDAIAIVPGTAAGTYGLYATIEVDGRVDGGTANGISLTSGALQPGGYLFAGSSGAITVASGGSITGATGITVGANPGNPYGTATLSVDNSGTIGGSRLALGSTTPTLAYFSSVTNEAGGTIGAINAAIGSLTNRGTITGDVVVTGIGQYGQGSQVDTSGGGTISGSLTLPGSSQLTVDFGTAAAPISGIGGSIVTTGSANTLQLDFAADTTLATPLVLPAGFSAVTYQLAKAATLTLASGYAGTTALTLGGDGTKTAFVNNGTLATAGPAITAGTYGISSVTNAGAINATFASNTYGFAVSLGQVAFTNSGSIIATGGGGLNVSGPATNSGTITASGIAVQEFSTSFANTGTITSTGGTGFFGFGSNDQLTNSGTITGALVGADLSNETLVNTGTISSPNIGVGLEPYATLDNRAGGTVSGGIRAPLYGSTFNAKVINSGTINGDVNFGSTGAYSYYGTNNTYVAATGGILNGNLVLGDGNDTLVVALVNNGPGAFAGITGTVTGGGTNDRLRYLVPTSATAVVPAAGGMFSQIGYELSGGATLTLTAAAQARSIDFAGTGSVDLTADLSATDKTILNLAAVPAATPYPYPANALAVTSHGTLSATRSAAGVYSASPAIVLSDGDSFTNTGTIVVTDLTTGAYSPLIGISGGGTVTNSGTITLNNSVGISLSPYGGVALTVINSGTIGQTGSAASQGIVGAMTVVNSGSIVTGGVAVTFSSASAGAALTNSGTIRSTGDTAVSAASYGAATVTNLAGGSIAGQGSAIVLVGGGVVDNAGTIVGNVVLGCGSGAASYCYSGTSSSYIARSGGTLQGNLTFGAGDDVFVSSDGTTGVTGTIDGGSGINTFARTYATTQTVSAATPPLLNFQQSGIGASGATTVITVTGPAAGLDTGLLFFGDGAIVNQANVNAAPTTSARHVVLLGDTTGQTGIGATLAFTTTGILADGVSGSARSFDNRGTIGSATLLQPAVSLTAAGDGFTFTNSGSILTSATGGCDACSQPIAVLVQTLYGTVLKTASFANVGTISGGILLDLAATDITITNSGSTSAATQSPYGFAYAIGSIIYASGGNSSAAHSLTFTNSGTIAGGLELSVVADTLSITNSGSLSASPNSQLQLTGSPVYTYDPTTFRSTRTDTSAATLVNSGTMSGGAFLDTAAKAVTVTNSGTIVVPGATPTGFAALAVSQNTLTSATTTVGNNGTFSSANAGGAALIIQSTAAPDGTTAFGTNATGATSTVTVANSGVIRADGGAVLVPADATFNQPAQLVAATALTVSAASDAPSQVTITNAAGGIISAIGTPQQVTSSGNVAATGAFATGGSVAVLASASRVTITNAGQIVGGDGFTAPAGTTIVVPLTPPYAGTTLAGAIQTVGAIDTLVNTKTGSIIGSIDLGAGDDHVENYGTIKGNVTLGDGNDSVVESLGGVLTGTIDGGTGTNTLTLDTTGGGLLDQTLLNRFIGFAAPVVIGNGTITTTGPLNLPTLMVSSGTLTIAAGSTLQTAGPVTITTGDAAVAITNLGTIAGGVVFGKGNNALTNAGTIGGAVVFGAGNDTLTLQHGSRTASIDGGGGSNALVLAAGGSDATPDEFNLSQVTNFQSTQVTSGVAALSGTFATGTLTVAAGRLIGRSGSTITAPVITVAPGATFGSAGTVVGNIAVAGTLSPGASPGTMTVTGNVSLASTSNSLFELTPAVSDQLLVSGTLTIASGATLTLTGNRALTPGAPLDLIVAGGGITGTFTTIAKPAAILGFVRQSGSRIQLFGEFAIDSSFAPQTARTVAYVNSLLVGATASPALLTAVPLLLTAAGGTSAPAFAALNAEPYASASRIGTENGLSLATALRTAGDNALYSRDGWFTFGEGIGAWRQLRGDAATGVSRADVSSGGAIGGIGIARGPVSLTAFGGYLDSRQSIATLGAHNVAGGATAGLAGTLTSGAFRATATLAYDGSDIRTTRTVPGAKTVASYSLHGFVADATLAYALPLGTLRLTPLAGFTHVATVRGAASETGSAAFDLTVAGVTDTANFIDGELRLTTIAKARFVPWFAAGVRHELDGRVRTATGVLTGSTTSLTVLGVPVAATVASASAGFNWHLTAPLALFGVYRGEFASGETGHSAMIGARYSF